MTTLKIVVNREEVCVAGLDSARGVVSAIVTLVVKEGEEVFLDVSGLDAGSRDQYRGR